MKEVQFSAGSRGISTRAEPDAPHPGPPRDLPLTPSVRFPSTGTFGTRAPLPQSVCTSMEFGTNCHLSTCLHLSFLPLSCPYCHHSFCESHFLPRQHACTAPGSANNVLSSNEVLKRVLRANPASTRGPGSAIGDGGARLPCQKRGCKKFSLEVGKEDSGSNGASNSRAGQEGAQARVVVKDGTDVQTSGRAFEHAAPTCVNCKGLYCMG